MNPEGLRELIEDLQRQQTELDNVEVKSAQRGTPKRIYEALSAVGADESRHVPPSAQRQFFKH